MFMVEVIGYLMETSEVSSNETKKFRHIGVNLRQKKSVIIMEQRRYVEGRIT